MKQRRGHWARSNCAALLVLGSVCTASAFKDEFLVLSEPMFVGNKVHFTITGEADAVYVIESSEDSIYGPRSSPTTTGPSRAWSRWIVRPTPAITAGGGGACRSSPPPWPQELP